MLTLILDTSTDYTLLALADGNSLLAEYPLPVGRASIHLMPSIQGFLKCHALNIKDLKSIAIGIGPGAFTGTRIGVTIAKTLGYALDIPLLPFCSLRAFKPLAKGPFTSLIDAKGGMVYAISGSHAESTSYESPQLHKLEELTGQNLLSPDAPDLQARLHQPHLKWHTVTPSAGHLASQLSSLTPTPADDIEVLYLRTP